jgi:hypothetical protein
MAPDHRRDSSLRAGPGKVMLHARKIAKKMQKIASAILAGEGYWRVKDVTTPAGTQAGIVTT